MNEVIGLDVKLNGGQQAEQSVKNIRQQFREAQKELFNVSAEYGMTSKEAIKAAKHAAELKEVIADSKKLMDAFNPQEKFKAVTQSLAGVAGGFEVFKGSMALFGSETEEVEKQLLKVQAAMALAEGLNRVGEAGEAFKRLSVVIKTHVVSAFGSLKAALISTGIGALVVGLGLLIANWEAVKEAILKVIPGLETLGKWLGKVVDSVTDFIGITSDATRAFDEWEKAFPKIKAALENQIKILEATGGKEKEIAELKKKLADYELEMLEKKEKAKGELNDKDLEQQQKVLTEKAVVEAAYRKHEKEEWEKHFLKMQEEEKEHAKLEFEIFERAYLSRKGVRDREKADVWNYFEELRKEKDEEEKRIKKGQEEIAEFTKRSNEKGLGALLQKNASERMYDVNNYFARLALQQEYVLNKKKLFDMEINLANIVADLIGRQTLAGKAIAIAAATINTYKAASEALAANYGPFGPLAAVARFVTVATTIATGLAQVKNIAAVNIPGAAGSSSVSAPGISSSAPSLNTSAPLSANNTIDSRTVSLDAQSINAIGNQTVRA